MKGKNKLNSISPKVSTIDLRVGSKIVKRVRGWRLQQIRERILLRDDYECAVCGRASADLEVDHIMPLHMGGAESDENRQLLCAECHKAKSEREESERA